ncbi:MAG: MFS transporter [Gammaproteobacteria bacterium]
MSSPTPATAGLAVTEHPLSNANFRRWLLGGTISLFGDQFYLVALPWLVLELTGSGLALGAVMMAGAIPRAVLMLFGGAASDYVSARRIMMATATARTICVAAIGIMVWSGIMRMWELYMVVVVFGVADAFAAPAASAYLPSLVKHDQMVTASSLQQTTALLSTIAGPAPAGLVVNVLGIASAFLIDAFSFLFIIGALWKLPDPPVARSAHKNVLHSIAEGISYVVRDVPLRAFMLLATMLNFCISGPIVIGLAYLTHAKLGGAATYGLMISAVAAGSLLGAVLAGVWKVRRRGIVTLVASFVISMCLGSIGLLGNAWSVASVLFLMGATAGLVNVHIGAWIMQRIEVSVRGRVSSVLMLSSVGLAPVSLAVTGLLVAWSLKGMFLVAGAAMLLVATGAALRKSVREIA